jgi:hypothetical protein
MAEGFDFRQGKFRPVWRRKFDQCFPYKPAALTDVDHNGEEEMTLPDSNGSPFLTFRGESEFIAPPAKVLCAIGCPPFCTDAYTKGPPTFRMHRAISFSNSVGVSADIALTGSGS